MRKVSKPQPVGHCDLCGHFSSKLFEGACPRCNAKYHPLFASDEHNDQTPIGYEAADIVAVRKTA